MMKRLKHSGFTIIEVMIVLAVTGGLFVAIASTMAGRQRTNEFTQAIQDAQSQIQQVISQVSVGNYPGNGTYKCINNGGSIDLQSGAAPQGTNSACVFLGKTIQFKVLGTDPEQLRVYTIAGLILPDSGTSPPANKPFSTSSPVAVSASNSHSTWPNNATQTITLKYGLTTQSVTVGGTPVGSVAFLMEQNTLQNIATNSYNSGSQPVDLVPIGSSTLNQNQPTAADVINGYISGATTGGSTGGVNPSNPVLICFASGSTNQSGLITIGGNGGKLTVKLDIKSNTTCS